MAADDPGLRELRDEIETTLKEIDGVIARQRDVARDTAEAAAVLASIRAGYIWKTLEAYRAARLYLRGKTMRWRGLRARAVSATRNRDVPRAVRELPLGVNVAGYLSTESGMGEAARASIRSLEAAGVPMVLTNVASRLRTQDLSYSAFTDANPIRSTSCT